MLLNATYNSTGINNTVSVTPQFTGRGGCFIYFGDETGESVDFNASIYDISHSYESYGYYNISLMCFGPSTFSDIQERYVYAGIAVSNVSITNEGVYGAIPVNATSANDIIIELAVETGMDYTVEAWITDVTAATTTLTGISNRTTPVTLDIDWFTEVGIFLLNVNVSNAISSEYVTAQIAFQFPVVVSYVNFEDYSLPPYVMLANHETILQARVLSGSNVTVALAAMENNNYTVYGVVGSCFENDTIKSLPFMINSTGTIEVKVEIFNYVSYYMEVFYFQFVYKVNNLHFNTSATLFLSDERFQLHITVGGEALPMGNVTCLVSYQDGQADDTVQFTDDNRLGPFSVTHRFVAGIYNVTVNCTNGLPEVVGGQNTSMTFVQEITVENRLDNLTLNVGDADTDGHPWSRPLLLSVENANPDTDQVFSDIACNLTLDGLNVPLEGTVSSSSQLTYSHRFSAPDTTYNISLFCKNQLSNKTIAVSVEVYIDCWNSTVYFDDVYKDVNSPILTQTHLDTTVRTTDT